MRNYKYYSIFLYSVMVFISFIYESTGGLIIELNYESTKVFAKDVLMSSGGDDSSIVSFAMIVFIVPLIGSFISLFKRSNFKTVSILNLVAVAWFAFWLILVEMDISIFKSIILGDYLLLLSLCLSFLIVTISVNHLFLILKNGKS